MATVSRRRGDAITDPVAFRDNFAKDNPRFPKAWPKSLRLTSRHGIQVLEGGPVDAPAWVHLHGGSYSKTIDPVHLRTLPKMARQAGRRILLPLYPLAPEHTWRDSRDALIDIVSGVGPGAVLSGDSAGGGYALSVAQGVRDRGLTMPEKLVLISPWLDLTGTTPGIVEAAEQDPWLRLDNLPVYARWWAGAEEDRTRPEASPGLGDLEGLPPALGFCGTRDLLFPENAELADRAALAGWDYQFVVGDGLIHVYPLLPFAPESASARESIVDFVRVSASR